MNQAFTLLSRRLCLVPVRVLWIFLSVFSAFSAAQAQSTDLELHYEKRTGDVIAVVNKKAVNISAFAATQQRSLTYPQRRARAIASANKLLADAASAFGLRSFESEVRVTSAEEDPDAQWVVRHEQVYKGVPIYGGGFSTRVANTGDPVSANATVLRNVELDTRPRIKVSSAAKIAVDDITKRRDLRSAAARMNASFTATCTEQLIRGKKRIAKCVKNLAKEYTRLQKYYVTQNPTLYIFDLDYLLSRPSGTARLAYGVGVVNAASDGEEIFVDAQNGKVIWRSAASETASERWVYDCSNPKGDNLCYSRLGPDSNPPYTTYAPYTFGRREGAPTRGPNPVPGPSFGSTDVDTIYNLLGSSLQPNTKSLYSFFKLKFGRDGGNGLGGNGDGVCPTFPTQCPGILGNNGAGTGSGIPVNVTKVNVNVNGVDNGPVPFCAPGNAQFAHYPVEEPSIKVCRGTVQPDILAHEDAHAIPWFLNYQGDGIYHAVIQGPGQSGALNESHSDIMGIAFQYYMEGETGPIDWSFGNGSNVPVLRVLSNPSSSNYNDGTDKPYPDRFNSPTFYCGSGDESGVHVNSTVPSHGAALAATGGNFNGCSIQGIGLDKVLFIWNRAVTHYFTFTTSFNGAYVGLTLACQDFASGAALASTVGPVITPSDCDNFAKALQAVEMDQIGGCNGSVPAQNPVTPTCAPAPGDFNNDDLVDLTDYQILRCSWGNSGTNLPADGNHNGVVDAPDYQLWLTHYTPPPAAPPQPTLTGDYDYDGDVDGNDYLVWQRTFGNVGMGMAADGSCNGVIDAGDYVLWRDRFGDVLH